MKGGALGPDWHRGKIGTISLVLSVRLVWLSSVTSLVLSGIVVVAGAGVVRVTTTVCPDGV